MPSSVGAANNQDITRFTKTGDVNGAQVQVHADAFRDAFWPAVPMGLDMGGGNYVQNCGEKGACFYATKISTGFFDPGSGNVIPKSDTVETLTYKAWVFEHAETLPWL